jgi:tetratricopeptide (TPR) repeat protein
MKKAEYLRFLLAMVAAICILLAAAAGVQGAIDRGMAQYQEAPEVLWIRSGKILKRLSLGNEALLADVYWTRAVQYYGGQIRDHKSDFSLLGPLLDITVDLDPHLLIAYKFGAIFLCEPSPRGAGDPQQAVRLIRKGIEANPDEWRLWHDLGFIYYWNLHDYPAAAAAYMEGSKNPHAARWMKVMAALILQKGGNLETSRLLWTEIYQSAEDESIRKNAYEHLQGLKAREDIAQIEKRVNLFHEQTGRWPQSLSEVVKEGLLRAVPLDPDGFPYRIQPDGKVGLSMMSTVMAETE